MWGCHTFNRVSFKHTHTTDLVTWSNTLTVVNNSVIYKPLVSKPVTKEFAKSQGRFSRKMFWRVSAPKTMFLFLFFFLTDSITSNFRLRLPLKWQVSAQKGRLLSLYFIPILSPSIGFPSHTALLNFYSNDTNLLFYLLQACVIAAGPSRWTSTNPLILLSGDW